MPSAAASSAIFGVASSSATSRCRDSIVSRRSMALLFAVEVRMPASSVIVFRYNTPAMPPASSAINTTTNGARLSADFTGLPGPTRRVADIFCRRRCRRS